MLQHNAPQSQTEGKGTVLAVDDDPASLMILNELLETSGYNIFQADCGREALSIVEREADNLDVIVLDKMMPDMNGLEVVQNLKDNPRARHIPTIMVTGSDSPEEIREGIDAGVFYYLTKPYEHDVFQSVIVSAMREADRRTNLKSELKKHQTSFSFIDRADFTIQKLDEAEALACFIANCFDNPDKTLPGLASLLVNAVEHGNLEIGYDLKSELISCGKWHSEIDRREHAKQYADRKVQVHLERNANEISVRIEDEGAGFNWKKYLEIDPARALDTHGRGIAQAHKICFDEISYNDKGNAVTAVSKIGSGITW